MTSNSTTAGTKVVTKSQIGNVVNGTDTTANGCYIWNQVNGQNASTTGTIYGIYDLSGGLYERTASFISNGNVNLWRFGQAVIDAAGVNYTENAEHTSATVNKNTGTSSKYVSIYSPYTDTVNEGSDTADNGRSQSNFKEFTENSNMYGDAVKETTASTAGTANSEWNTSSWNNDYSCFPEASSPSFYRGGHWSSGGNAGEFTFNRSNGGPSYYTGFRPVLVASSSL